MAPVSSYNFKDDVLYVRNVTEPRTNKTIYSKIVQDSWNKPQYSLEAYSTSNKHNIKLQYPNNFVVPVYHNRLAISTLNTMLNKDPENDYVIIIERYVINSNADASNLLDYYSTGNLRGIANTKENADICKHIREQIKNDRYPIETEIMHLVDLSKLKGLKSVYLPNLNLQMYIGDMSRKDVHPLKHYVGDYAPKSAIKQEGIVQAIFRIVDNSNPGKMYFTKMFGEVYSIQSVENRMERDNVKIAIISDDIEIENKSIRGLDKLKENGIYSSLVECENGDNIDKIIEVKKLELELEKISLARHKNALDHSSNLQKHILESNKIKFEYVKLETDTFKNIVDLKNINYKIKELNNASRLSKEAKKNIAPNPIITNTKGILDIAIGGLKFVLNISDLF